MACGGSRVITDAVAWADLGGLHPKELAEVLSEFIRTEGYGNLCLLILLYQFYTSIRMKWQMDKERVAIAKVAQLAAEQHAENVRRLEEIKSNTQKEDVSSSHLQESPILPYV